MKRSEFDRKLGERAAWRTDNRHAGEWAMVDRSDLHALLEEAGTPWDPEEPELPGDLEVERSGPGAMIGRRGGRRLVDVTRVDRQYPMEEDEIGYLEAIVDAANRLPAMEALARDLAEEVLEEHDTPYANGCEVCELLYRAHSLGFLP